MHQRKEFAIQITTDGRVYVAQGNPAQRALEGSRSEAACETGLYFSQMRHRAAVRRANGTLEITTPSCLRHDDQRRLLCDVRGIKCTGAPVLVGTI
jgi:hypothetical protein